MTKTQKIGYLEKVLINRMPKGWEKTLLKDVLEIQGGFAFDSKCFSDDNGIQLIRIRDLKNGYTTDTLYDGSYDDDYLVKAGDYLIGMDGDFICYQWKGQDSLLNQRVCRLRNFDKQVNPRFVYFGINKHLERINQKTSFATVKHISMKQIGAIEFALPPLPQQEKIVSVLDTASALVEKQKNLLEQYDLFLKSKFIEMFGDPVKNPMEWDISLLSSVVSENCSLSYGIVQPGDFVEDGIPIVRPVDLTETIICKSLLKRTEPQIAHKYKRTFLKGGEILLCVRGTVGLLARASNELFGANVTRGIVPIICNDDTYKNLFLYYLLKTDAIQDVIKRYAKGIALVQINIQDLRQIELVNPPYELQSRFAQIAEQIESIQQKERQKLEKLQILYDALMKRAFDGEIE